MHIFFKPSTNTSVLFLLEIVVVAFAVVVVVVVKLKLRTMQQPVFIVHYIGSEHFKVSLGPQHAIYTILSPLEQQTKKLITMF